jgi:anaerobic selenocysteine-containing dehydrogenase
MSVNRSTSEGILQGLQRPQYDAPTDPSIGMGGYQTFNPTFNDYQSSPEWLQSFLQARSGRQNGMFQDTSDVWNQYQPQIQNRWQQDSFFNPAFMKKDPNVDFNTFNPFERQIDQFTRRFRAERGGNSISASQRFGREFDPFEGGYSNYQALGGPQVNKNFGNGAALYANDKEQQLMQEYNRWLNSDPWSQPASGRTSPGLNF